MAKRSRILRTVGNGPNSVLRAHTSDQNVPARVVMDAQTTTHAHPDRAYGNIACPMKRPAASPDEILSRKYAQIASISAT